MAAGDGPRARARQHSTAVLTGPVPVRRGPASDATDALRGLRVELDAAQALVVHARRTPGEAPGLVLACGDVADAASRATRAGAGQEARRLLQAALADPVAVDAPWRDLVDCALQAVEAVAWPDDEPWGALPAPHPGRGTTPSDRGARPV